ncbi:MAG TPA: transcription termination factor Rho [Candidatus Dojkabacteria bacterium]|uniref:Transcription termination factor Rho n=1 Tax=Candidatus Dojkabacteria bacterium TaxID=2099670 RepID=A0A847D000_9BACT|nr:transcription termination factor Rho [Candidatus Dojkabacteria bacterium]NLD25034.1 transcription termination factor Rho [Candidatus Dojkabacteria bacterium]HNW32765.1 transcription termination factor Rho [Candidatus Dojkabacteria bacterium]HOZ44650.1 transcription termination factor Rho [Candidatus Dojkabacteria bacterium]HQC39290.1 transcription termination factor Rho [Candidatus Dojkabacteria bacterium]
MVKKSSKTIKDYEAMTLADIRAEAQEIKLENFMELPKRELIIEILKKNSNNEGFVEVSGILEVMKDASHGILRTEDLLPGDNDVYISGSQIQKFSLRTGDEVTGPARLPKDKEKYLSLLRVDTVYGKPAAEAAKRPNFRKLTPIFPNKQIKLETDQDVISTRMIDLLSPIGFGQRSMVVSPPKAGKTWLLKDIANGIAKNHPKAKLIVVLVGERPEEVTDMKRFVKGEVYASNFDELPQHNCSVAEMALQKAMRMVEWGEDVIILMDSITRLARAYNITMPTSGKTLSGGFDPVALYPPKRFFGAARNFEESGSLTIIATALVDTGSRMDDLVYEEFKGTGNMELHLDRSLANKRVYPSIDVNNSGTRNEELLLGKEVLNQSWRIRRMLEFLDSNENPTEVLIDRLKKTKNNEEFLATLHEA